MVIVSLKPVHNASLMEVMTTGETANVDSTSILVETDGALKARDPRGARWRQVSITSRCKTWRPGAR